MEPLPLETPGTRRRFSQRTNIQRRLAQFDVSGLVGQGHIAFDYGLPDQHLFPLTLYQQAAEQALAYQNGHALQYGGGDGGERIRAFLADRFSSKHRVPCDPEEVLVTNGTAQSLDLLAFLFLAPEDEVWVESPSYFGALQVFATHDVKTRAFPMDYDGLCIDAIEEELVARQATGRPMPKFIYVIPNYHNPTGTTMRLERRVHLAKLASRFGFFIVEDDAYGELYYGEPILPIRHFCPDRTVYLYTFSKTIAPGFRIGAIAAPGPVIRALQAVQFEAGTNPFTQQVVANILSLMDYDQHLERVRQHYSKRKSAMADAMADHLKEYGSWHVPEGGFFIWFCGIEDLDVHALWGYALRERVSFIGASPFYSSGDNRRQIRLSFSYDPPERLREGINRLHRAISSYMEGLKS